MSYPEAIISGIIQGLTEFLPVSSSGHLVILHHYFGYKAPSFFYDIFLHVATLFAILAYFRRDIIKIITRERRLLSFIIVSSAATAVIGLGFKDILESFFANVDMVGAMLFVTAGFLLLGEWASRRQEESAPAQMSWAKALIIGLMQGISIIPGISRSGSTIAGGILLKLDRQEAVRFSFLIAIPAIAGAFVFELSGLGANISVTLPMIAGAATAFLTGLLAIKVLLIVVCDKRLVFFAIYCILLGGIILAL